MDCNNSSSDEVQPGKVMKNALRKNRVRLLMTFYEKTNPNKMC